MQLHNIGSGSSESALDEKQPTEDLSDSDKRKPLNNSQGFYVLLVSPKCSGKQLVPGSLIALL